MLSRAEAEHEIPPNPSARLAELREALAKPDPIDRPRPRLLPYMLSILALAVFAGIGWWAYRSINATPPNGEVPVVAASSTPEKVPPPADQAAATSNTSGDKTVYNEVAPGSAPEPKTEVLLPPPEAPQLPAATGTTQPSTTAAATGSTTAGASDNQSSASTAGTIGKRHDGFDGSKHPEHDRVDDDRLGRHDHYRHYCGGTGHKPDHDRLVGNDGDSDPGGVDIIRQCDVDGSRRYRIHGHVRSDGDWILRRNNGPEHGCAQFGSGGIAGGAFVCPEHATGDDRIDKQRKRLSNGVDCRNGTRSACRYSAGIAQHDPDGFSWQLPDPTGFPQERGGGQEDLEAFGEQIQQTCWQASPFTSRR